MRKYLFDLRKQHCESQQDVADAVGVTRQYYQQIEAGIRQKKMDVTLLTKLADHFGMTIIKIAELERKAVDDDMPDELITDTTTYPVR